MLYDFVMWTKNGQKTLSSVLKQIDRVIPKENIKNRIVVDDDSIDNTVEIAKDFNWKVYENPFTGITSGANECLRHVTTPFFISFEQDVILSKEWWDKIPKYMDDPKIAVAQGIRLSTNPILHKIDEYVYNRMKSSSPLEFGVSIDNNIYRTEIIRKIGGFPYGCKVCTDTILMKKIMLETPYNWVVDRSVISEHIRESLEYHFQHCYQNTRLCSQSHYCAYDPLKIMIRILLTSPIRGFLIAYKKKCPQIIWVYSLIRFMKLKGFIIGRENDA